MSAWRMALGVLLALLLPVPLLLLLGSVTQVRPGALHLEGARVSPVLGFEARMLRPTYGQECRTGADCEPPLGCLRDQRTRTRYCIDSECMTDEQCPEGQTCQRLPTLDEGPLVRYCIPLGVRQEGEECLRPPRDKEVACRAGLVCAGVPGRCGRPCHVAGAASCAEGFFCADVAPQPVCLPTCEALGCPEGQHCVLYKEGASRCVVVHGSNCQQSPCPDGRECEVLDVARQPDRVWMSCVEKCGDGHPACPAGRACDVSRCRPSCDPQVPDACGKGYRCGQRKPEEPSVCQPDV